MLRLALFSVVLTLLCFTEQAIAVCLAPPKVGLTTDQVLIQTNRVAGIDVTNIIMAWPTTDANLVCCTRAVYDRRAWQVILDEQIPRGTVTLTEFVMAIDPPGGEKTPAENAICQTMADRILPPAPRVVRNSQRTDGARPMFTLNTTGSLVNLKVSGVQVYVEAGRVCERTPVIRKTTAGSWLYTTNAAGVRGIALCK
ncbi:MAG: hypothetical protein ACYCZR_07045 [Burkholderiales bacterium]